jgi:hypothetical protein
MRPRVDASRIERFMREIGRIAKTEVRIYLVGGATAVLEGWRQSTVDIDLTMEPEPIEIFQALPRLKEQLDVNIELAAPSDFVPELPGWRARSRFIATYGKAHFFHYDAFSQLLSKIERGHTQDLIDVEHMLASGLVDPDKALELFAAVADQLIRYPAIDADTFRSNVDLALRNRRPTGS